MDYNNEEPKAQTINIPGLNTISPNSTDSESIINNPTTLESNVGKPTLQSNVGAPTQQVPVKQVDLSQLNLSNPLEGTQSSLPEHTPHTTQADAFNRVKRILASCIPPRDYDDRVKETNKEYISMSYKLQSKLNHSDFKDLDWIMFQAISYFSDINGIITKPLLLQYLTQYGDKLLHSQLVDVNRILAHKNMFLDVSIESGFEQAKMEIYSALADYFDELQGIEISLEEFNSQLAMYCEYLFSQQQERILKECLIIKTKGMDVFIRSEKKRLYGAMDADDHYNRNIQYYKLKYMRDETTKIIDTTKGVLQLKELHNELKDTFKVVATLGVTAIDSLFKGFRPTKCLGIEGGASSGKTRLSRGIAYRAMTMYKQNVLDITMEQPRGEIFYIYVATHLYCKYNVYIPDNKIMADELSDVQRQLVRIAELDLFDTTKYGGLRIESRNMNIEDAIQELKAIKATEFDYGVILVDYVGLINSKDMDKYGTTDKHSIVTTFYQRFKREICVEQLVFGIILNQLAKDGVFALAKGGETTTYDGSNSGETYKTPDYNIVCFQSEQLREANQIQLTLPKVRQGKKTGRVYASTPMGAASFKDVERPSDELDAQLEKEEEEAS